MQDTKTADRRSKPFRAAACGADAAATFARPRSLNPGLCAAALLLAAHVLPAAAAQDFPHLRPGLWEMERIADPATSGSGRPMPSSRTSMCLDESVQRDMFEMASGAMKGACSKHDFKLTGNGMTGDVVCDIGGSRMHSKSVMVLEGDRAYRTEIDTTYDPPLMGESHTKMVMLARNVGPCKPGQRAGDLILPNGQTMNMRDVMNGRQGAHGTIAPPGSPKH